MGSIEEVQIETLWNYTINPSQEKNFAKSELTLFSDHLQIV